jgi:DnaJ-class molecular chaperone
MKATDTRSQTMTQCPSDPDTIYQECPACSGVGEIAIGMVGNHLEVQACPKCDGEGWIEHDCAD